MKALSILLRKDNCTEAAFLLLTTLKVPVTFTTLETNLENHPDYPSLLSVSDVLIDYGVANITIKIGMEKLEELPVPFLAHVAGQESHMLFAVVRSVSNHYVEYFDSEKYKWVQVPKGYFEKQWPSGLALIVDKEEAKGEANYAQKRREEKRISAVKYATYLIVPILTILASILSLANYGMGALFPVGFSILTLSGCIATSLLLWYEIDQYNPILQQICSAGKKVNCRAVLDSKASKIWGISWSSIGFTYFSGSMLVLLFTGISNPYYLFFLSWLNLLALPYVFFSVYYQWRIARQWCLLCLIVQGLLVLQFFTTLFGRWHSSVGIDAIHAGGIVLAVLISFTVPFIIVNLLLPGWRAAKENKRNKSELQRLKHNPLVFDTLLSKQKQITQNTDGLGIILGNPYGKNKIIKVCSPYCGPCAKVHPQIEELLANNPDIQVQIIFFTPTKGESITSQPVRHLLAIAEQKDESTIKRALHDWYLPEEKNYEVFAANFVMNGALEMQEPKLDAMRRWCDLTEIQFTPTIFVNGYQLPEIYNVSDLKFLLSFEQQQ